MEFSEWKNMGLGNFQRHALNSQPGVERIEQKTTSGKSRTILKYQSPFGEVDHRFTSNLLNVSNDLGPQSFDTWSLKIASVPNGIYLESNPIISGDELKFKADKGRSEVAVEYHRPLLAAKTRMMSISYLTKDHYAELEQLSVENLFRRLDPLYSAYGNDLLYIDVLDSSLGLSREEYIKDMDQLVDQRISEVTRKWSDEDRESLFPKMIAVNKYFVNGLVPSAKSDQRFIEQLTKSAAMCIPDNFDQLSEDQRPAAIIDAIKSALMGIHANILSTFDMPLNDFNITFRNNLLRYGDRAIDTGIKTRFDQTGQIDAPIQFDGQEYNVIDLDPDYFSLEYGNVTKTDRNKVIIPKAIERKMVTDALRTLDPLLGLEVIERYRRFFLNQ